MCWSRYASNTCRISQASFLCPEKAFISENMYANMSRGSIQRFHIETKIVIGRTCLCFLTSVEILDRKIPIKQRFCFTFTVINTYSSQYLLKTVKVLDGNHSKSQDKRLHSDEPYTRWQGWLQALHIAKGTFLRVGHFHPFFIFLITHTADHHNTVMTL